MTQGIALPPFRIPPDAEVEAELAEAMPLLRRMEAAIQKSDDDEIKRLIAPDD
jgi:hypothetical protein